MIVIHINQMKSRETLKLNKLNDCLDTFGNIQTIKEIIGDSEKKIKPPTIRIRDKLPWVDKYRPKTLHEVIGHTEVKNVLKKSIHTGDLPHLLFHGGSGTGKTSTVLALAMQLYGPRKIGTKVLELNASDENGINVVRDKIITFAKIVVGSADPKYPSPPFKLIILDEADAMTGEAQTALKKVMETTCDITRFVFICNYENRIIEPIKSRCASFRFSPIPQDIMIQKMRDIAMHESISISDKVLEKITDICEGDARQSIMTMQNLKYCNDEITEITIDDVMKITSSVKTNFLDNVWATILNGDIKTVAMIARQIINTGYPSNNILQCITSKVNQHDQLTNRQKSAINLYIANVERMLSHGSDYQILVILCYVNAIHRKLDVITPSIY